MMLRRRVELLLGVVTAILGLAALAVALGAPLGTETRSCTTSGGINQAPTVDCSLAGTQHISAIENQGLVSLLPAILAFSAVLLAIAGFAYVHSRSGARSSLTFLWIFTVLLWVMMLLAALSIGVFLVPAALVALITAILASQPDSRGEASSSPA